MPALTLSSLVTVQLQEAGVNQKLAANAPQDAANTLPATILARTAAAQPWLPLESTNQIFNAAFFRRNLAAAVVSVRDHDSSLLIRLASQAQTDQRLAACLGHLTSLLASCCG